MSRFMLCTFQFAFHMYISITCLYNSVTCIFHLIAFFSLPSWAFLIIVLPWKLIEILKTSLAFLSSEEFFMLDSFPQHIHTDARCECVSLRECSRFPLLSLFPPSTYLYIFSVTVLKSHCVSLSISRNCDYSVSFHVSKVNMFYV